MNRMLPTIVVLVLLRCLSALRPPLRVYAGHDDIHNEFPFAVRMEEFTGELRCTGSLIARNWVLTAGHCTDDNNTDFVVRYANFIKKHAKRAVARVLKVIAHPNYIRPYQNVLRHDIALLQTTNIANKPIGKISALDYRTLMGLPVKYAGFGHTDEEYPLINLTKIYYYATERTPLQVVEAVVRPYFHSEKDSVIIREPITILVAPKCSKKEQGCRGGDSGGPVIYDGKIVGVCSGVAEFSSLASYTAVSPYLPWIRYQMRINGYKPS